MRILRKTWVIVTLALMLMIVITVLICWGLVSSAASDRSYNDVEKIPANRVGIVLGTSPFTRQGVRNLYFDTRIDAASELYKAGKVKHFILSGGDYRGKQEFGYDEPASMRDSLKVRGVPESAMTLDYDGVRTNNSIIKAREIYGLDSVTLISQKYHNDRALYLANRQGLEAVAYNAELPNRRRLKNVGREVFARVKMFMDMVTTPKPEFSDTTRLEITE